MKVIYIVVDSIHYKCLDKYSKVFLNKSKAEAYAALHMMYVIEMEVID